VFLGANLKLFYYRGHTVSTHSHCSAPPHRSTVVGNIDSVLLYCIVCLCVFILQPKNLISVHFYSQFCSVICIFENTEQLDQWCDKKTEGTEGSLIYGIIGWLCLHAGKGCKQVLTNNDEISLVLPKNKGLCSFLLCLLCCHYVSVRLFVCHKLEFYKDG